MAVCWCSSPSRAPRHRVHARGHGNRARQTFADSGSEALLHARRDPLVLRPRQLLRALPAPVASATMSVAARGCGCCSQTAVTMATFVVQTKLLCAIGSPCSAAAPRSHAPVALRVASFATSVHPSCPRKQPAAPPPKACRSFGRRSERNSPRFSRAVLGLSLRHGRQWCPFTCLTTLSQATA
jgi:hypothetical protein